MHRMDLSFARIYAGLDNVEKVRNWEEAHKTNKCNDMDTFKSEYLDLLKHSYIPDFLKHSKNPAKFADFYSGYVLMQKLNRLLQQLEHVGQYASANVKSQLREIVENFWKLGMGWDEASTVFKDVKKHVGINVFPSSESQFRTYVVS